VRVRGSNISLTYKLPLRATESKFFTPLKLVGPPGLEPFQRKRRVNRKAARHGRKLRIYAALPTLLHPVISRKSILWTVKTVTVTVFQVRFNGGVQLKNCT
jgi:hypothetical protein